jgi:predicted RNA-binding Zn-ribbon protein involved in translation (DUF1610 family)
MSFQYQFDKTSRKFKCPSCGQRRFVRLVDTITKAYLDEGYGACDRKDNCGYSLFPCSEDCIQYSYASKRYTGVQSKGKQQVPIPQRILDATLRYYQHNTFLLNLIGNVPFPFEVDRVQRVAELYSIGTVHTSLKQNATTFPFIDRYDKIRAIQVKEFDETNHTKKYGTTFIHSLMEAKCKKQGESLPSWLVDYGTNDSKVSCLFGEHLLKRYPYHTIAIVEAPKSCVISTLYNGFPSDSIDNFLWLSCYNLSGLTVERCKPLQGREIVLFPDLSNDGSSFKKWQKQGEKIQKALHRTTIITSRMLEIIATQKQRNEGLDIADFFIQEDWRKFRQPMSSYCRSM